MNLQQNHIQTNMVDIIDENNQIRANIWPTFPSNPVTVILSNLPNIREINRYPPPKYKSQFILPPLCL